MIDKKLMTLIKGNEKYIVFTILLMLLSLFLNLTITGSICYTLSLVYQQAETSSYWLPLLIALLATVGRFFSSLATGYIKDILGRKVKKDLRLRTYDKILTIGLKNDAELNLAGLTQVTMEGIEQLDIYYSSYLPQFFYSMIAPLLLFVLVCFIKWPVALVLLACVPLIPASIIAVSKYAKKIFAKYWGLYTSMGDTFLDSVQGLKDLKIFKADEKRQTLINESAEQFRKITMKVLVMQLASTTIMDLVAYGGAGAGIATTIYYLFSNQLDVFLALFLILIALEFFLPLRSLGSAFHIAMNGLSAGKKIFTLLNTKENPWGEEKIDKKDVLLKDVTFSYDGSKNVLDHITLHCEEHQLTAVVGKSGSGKSTIVSLLSGFLRPNQGQVLVGNKDLVSLDRKDYYSHLSIVSYDTYIFNESIRNNFKLANPNCSDKEILSCLKKVNLDHLISDERSLDTIINEDASNLSGGERQRLALAIALINPKDIYLFDEATSNIDVESEKIIMDNILQLKEKATVLLISHRLMNVVNADKIYYLENGTIKEEGTHSSLMETSSYYANLFNTQKELEEGYLTNLKEAV